MELVSESKGRVWGLGFGVSWAKAILFAAMFVFISLPGLHAESAIDGFVKKAEIAKTDIEKSSTDLEKIRKEFDETGNKIQELKGRKAQGGFTGFLNGIALKVYLSSGNRLGYRIYSLEAGTRALKEDYFTYVSLITEEYGTQIKDCVRKKCGDLKELCGERAKWAAAADKYEDMLQIDLSSMNLIKNYSPGAAKDVRDYLQKKIVQAEQRIYMLEEDRAMFDIMKRAGVNADGGEKKRNTEKIAALKKLKKDLQEEMGKIN